MDVNSSRLIIIETVINAVRERYHPFDYIETSLDHDVYLSIQWGVNNDPERPNKRSREISVKIPRELIEDLPNYFPSMQEMALENVRRFIQDKLSTFNPDHGSPRGTPPPVEHWVIPVKVLG